MSLQVFVVASSLPKTGTHFSARCSRFCGHLSEPQDDGGESDDGEVVARGFLEAGGDASELLELGEAAFDEMALGVEVAVERMFEGT
jgi:hypothetical protein